MSDVLQFALPDERVLFAAAVWIGVAGVTLWVARQKYFDGKVFFLLTLAGMLLWLGAVILELGATSAAAKIFWAKAAWPGIALLPTAWAFFLLDYTFGRDGRRSRLRPVLLLGGPAIVTLAAATNAWHGLFYGPLTALVGAGADAYVRYDHGPLFFLAAAYLYLFMGISIGVALIGALRGRRAYRGYFVMLSAVTSAPVAANLAYVLGGYTLFGFDPTPFFFAFILLVFTWMIVNNRLFDITVIAKDMLFEKSRNPIIVSRPDGEVTSANPEARALFDLSGSGNLRRCTHVGAVYDQLVAGHSDAPTPTIRVGGRSFDPSVIRIDEPLDLNTTPKGMILFLADVTERRSLEAALEAERERLSVLMETSASGILGLDPQARITFANQEAARLFGVPLGAILGQHLDNAQWSFTRTDGKPLCADEDILALFAADGAAPQAPPVRDRLLALRTDSRPERIVSVNAAPVGAPLPDLKVVLTLVDVTDRYEAERRLRAVVEVASDGIYDYQPKKGMVYFSEGFREAFGHPWVGDLQAPTPWLDQVHPDDREIVDQRMKRLMSGEADTWRCEFRLRRADGSWAVVQEKLVTLRDSEGRLDRIIGSVTDITEQRELEDKLRRAETLEAIGKLTGGVAHDFNNLLTIILGNADNLADAPELPAPLRDAAQAIVRAAERGATLTDGLLAFARRQPLAPRPLDAAAMLDEVRQMLSRSLPAGVELLVRVDTGTSPAMADPGQLNAALLNLAVNAFDAMPEGGTLTLGCRDAVLDGSEAGLAPDAPRGAFVCFTVADTGTGMSDEVLARVFDPFFTTKSPGKGVGMGMSMVYGFARQSGGHVAVHSAPGKGTTVELFLPRSPEAATGTGARGASAEVARGNGEVVLVVEDNALLRTYAREMISGMGYRVLIASNADEAMAALESQKRVDLLFSDVVMPGGTDGLELARRAATAWPGLRVLLTSGFTDARTPGADCASVPILPKPYRRAELARAIHAALHGQSEGTRLGL